LRWSSRAATEVAWPEQAKHRIHPPPTDGNTILSSTALIEVVALEPKSRDARNGVN
jgi:hypothetical protein